VARCDTSTQILPARSSSGNIDARPGNSVAVDLGVYYTKPLTSRNATLSLGASITNLGAKISYSDANNRDFIPTNLRMGGAYTRWSLILRIS
jgi:hypothetical protein